MNKCYSERFPFFYGALYGDVLDNDRISGRMIANIVVDYILYNMKKDKIFKKEINHDLNYIENKQEECIFKNKLVNLFDIYNHPISLYSLGFYFESGVGEINYDLIYDFCKVFKIQNISETESYIETIFNIRISENDIPGKKDNFSDVILKSKGSGNSMFLCAIL